MLPGESHLLCLPPLPTCLLLLSFRFKVLQAWVDSLRSLVFCVLPIQLTLLRPSVVLVPLLPLLLPFSFRFHRCSLANLASAGDKWLVSVNCLPRNWNLASGSGFRLIVNLVVIFCSAISAYLDGFDKPLAMQDFYHARAWSIRANCSTANVVGVVLGLTPISWCSSSKHGRIQRFITK